MDLIDSMLERAGLRQRRRGPRFELPDWFDGRRRRGPELDLPRADVRHIGKDAARAMREATAALQEATATVRESADQAAARAGGVARDAAQDTVRVGSDVSERLREIAPVIAAEVIALLREARQAAADAGEQAGSMATDAGREATKSTKRAAREAAKVGKEAAMATRGAAEEITKALREAELPTRRKRGRGRFMVLGGLVAAGAAAYFYDAEQGARRRAEFKERFDRLTGQVKEAADAALTELRARAEAMGGEGETSAVASAHEPMSPASMTQPAETSEQATPPAPEPMMVSGNGSESPADRS